MKKALCLMLAALMMVTALVSCSKTKEDQNKSGASSAPAQGGSQPLPERAAGAVDPNTGLYMNPLTGEFTLDKAAFGKRPYAVQINNIKEALPQWGVSSPDLYYEFLVEGGITRIMGMFANGADIPKIGPIRSARTYYVSTVNGYDALYVHFGASDTGLSLIRKLGVNDVDGMYMPGCFKRDPERSKIRDIEHTYYTNSEMVLAGVEKKQYRTDSNIENFAAFRFTNEGEDISVNGSASDANDIQIVFSKYTNSEFKYNADEKLYYKDEFGKPHVDANNDKQIAVRNVIVITDSHEIEPKNGKCLILGQKSGSGYLFSDGKAVKIKWTKNGHDKQYSYTTEEGEPLKLNPGKTYISVIRNDKKSSLTF